MLAFLPMFRKFCLSLSVVGLLFFAGCGARENQAGFDSAVAPSTAASAEYYANEKSRGAAPGASGAAPGAPATSDTSSTTSTAQWIQTASGVPRKIIYTATVDLISDNFPLAQQTLLKLVKTHQGYVAETNVSGTTGAPRQGMWKIRIPENQFELFMAAVVKLGELQSTQTDSDDVSAEYYDLQARIANKQVEEKRLIQHLNRSTAKLSDILQVEKELARVRGEIEQMQGRLRFLANVTALTTITVNIREVKDYVAPKPATFGDQIARTFQSSLGEMAQFGRGVVLALVALLPWLVVLALVALPFWKWLRRSQKGHKISS